MTRILQSLEQGDPKAGEQLLPLVYEELGKLAARPEHRDQSHLRNGAVFSAEPVSGAGMGLDRWIIGLMDSWVRRKRR